MSIPREPGAPNIERRYALFRDAIFRTASTCLITILLFPPCAQYADVEQFMPWWRYIGDLYSPTNLSYPLWDWVFAEAAVVGIVAGLALRILRRTLNRQVD